MKLSESPTLEELFVTAFKLGLMDGVNNSKTKPTPIPALKVLHQRAEALIRSEQEKFLEAVIGEDEAVPRTPEEAEYSEQNIYTPAIRNKLRSDIRQRAKEYWKQK